MCCHPPGFHCLFLGARQPDVVTMTSTIGACAKMKRWQQVVALFASADDRRIG